MPITKQGGKKDGLQRYRVRVNYTDADGKHRQRERIVYGLPEAKEAERRMLLEISAASSAKMTVSDLCALYLESKTADVRESSYADIEKNLRLYIVPLLGSIQLSALSALILQNWKNDIGARDFKLTTRRNIFKSFSGALNFAVRMDFIKENLLHKIGNFSDKNLETVSSERIRYYTPAQFEKYLPVAKQHANSMQRKGYYAFFAIAYYTGMRKGEINALKWSDINGEFINVKRSVNLKAKSGNYETPVKRAASLRRIQMPLPLIDILSEHRKAQESDTRFNDNWRVCGGVNFIPDSSLDRANRLYASEAGLPRITIHEFRHSHASVLCNYGINIKEISRRLGHANVEITWRTYSHLYPAEEERAIQVLNTIGVNSGDVL